jgi:hypothetical protein
MLPIGRFYVSSARQFIEHAFVAASLDAIEDAARDAEICLAGPAEVERCRTPFDVHYLSLHTEARPLAQHGRDRVLRDDQPLPRSPHRRPENLVSEVADWSAAAMPKAPLSSGC